jgi:hypothetical protein
MTRIAVPLDRVRIYETDDENERSAPAFPFSLIRVPSPSLEAIQPEGWTMEEFGPHIRGVQAALELGDLSLIDVPDGLTVDQMVQSVLEILLYAQAGVALISDRQKLVRNEVERIQERGISSVVIRAQIVLDADFRIIEGLLTCWALQAMGYDGIVPVSIRLDADPYAGMDHIRHLQDEYQKSRVNLDYDMIQRVLEVATPEERRRLAKMGHFPTRETVELHMSRENLRLLGSLIAKHLGYEIVKAEAAKAKRRNNKPVKREDLKIRFDPAQLLYVDTLREQITAAREAELDPDPELDAPEKLRRHFDEEARAIAAGKEFIGREGGWKSLGDGLFEHWAYPMYRFRIVEPEQDSPTAKKSPVGANELRFSMKLADFTSLARVRYGLASKEAERLYANGGADGLILPFLKSERPDLIEDALSAAKPPHLMELSQFRIFAKAHFGLDSAEADELYASEAPDLFNRRLRHYIDASPTNYKGKDLDKAKAPKRMALSDQPERLKLWRSAPED